MNYLSEKHLHKGMLILILFLAISVRLALLNWELPYYAVDENDTVELALSYLGGDLDPHWYKYGPLLSYLIAFIYKIWMWVSNVALGWTEREFFYKAIYEPTSFYVVARAFHALIIIGIAGISYLFAKRYYDRVTSFAALILGLSPFLDVNINFTIRVDTLVGLFSLISLYFAVQYGKDKIEFRPYILSGIFAGFAIASKPISGFLVLPALVISHFLHVWHISNLSFGKKIEFALLRPNIWLLACAVFVAHSLANPYSIINFDGFLLEHYNLFYSEMEEAQFLYYRAPYDFSWLVDKWGWPMVIAIILSLLASLRRLDNPTRILLVYIAVFIGGFLPFKSRDYWYTAVFPAVILIVARQVSASSALLVKYIMELMRIRHKDKKLIIPAQSLELLTICLLAFLLTFNTYWKTGLKIYNNWFSSVAPLEQRADRAAQLWIENNLPAHSSIILIGRHAVNLPRIVADTPRVEAVWGEYFSNHRYKNLPWGDAFENAYSLLQQKNRPAYRLFNIRERYILPSDTETNLLYRENMASIAREKGYRYLVVASRATLKGKWEDNPGIHLIAFFNSSTGHKGDEVKIFEVL